MSLGKHFPIHADLRHSGVLFLYDAKMALLCYARTPVALKAFSEPCRLKTLRSVVFVLFLFLYDAKMALLCVKAFSEPCRLKTVRRGFGF